MKPPPGTAAADLAAGRPDIRERLEALAAKVHESWMRQRLSEGWTFGPIHDGRLKQSPNLIPYDQLPENEKEVDRRTAWTTIQGMLDLGFGIAPVPAKATVDTPAWAEIRRKLAAPGSVPLDQLRSLWSQSNSLPAPVPADICLELGQRLLKQGEAILAYDVLAQGLESTGSGDAPERLRLSQLLALALAQSGAAERAGDLLLRLAQSTPTPETLGLLGRVYKDLAGRAGSPSARSQYLEESFQTYLAGFEMARRACRCGEDEAQAGAADAAAPGLRRREQARKDAYYCGINAAALEVLRERLPQAQSLAHDVKQVCLEQIHADEAAGLAPDYWLLATLAEAELIAGRLAEAEAGYRAALPLVQGNWRELCSTRRQARLLAPHLGLDAGIIDRVFPAVAIAVCLAPPWTRFLSEPEMTAWEEKQSATFKSHLAAEGVLCGFALALSPADILFAEALLEAGREINLILPVPRDVCRRVFEPAPAWAARFDRVLARVHSVIEDTQPDCLEEPFESKSPSPQPSPEGRGSGGGVNLAFAQLRAFGAGLLRARRLDARLQVWSAGANAWLDSWRAERTFAGDWQELRPPDGATRAPVASTFGVPPLGGSHALPPKGGTPNENPKHAPNLSTAKASLPGETYAIRAMLFGDVKGYSKLSDVELLAFARHFMKRAAEAMEPHSARILSRRTAGDGIFLVFEDTGAAVSVARALCELAAGTRWEDLGLPPGLGIRVSLDAGPVYAFEDPVTTRPEVCGAYVNRAARIEPITPPNEVYASEAFAALYVAQRGRAFGFEYVGQTQLPKGFGLTPLYCVKYLGIPC